MWQVCPPYMHFNTGFDTDGNPIHGSVGSSLGITKHKLKRHRGFSETHAATPTKPAFVIQAKY
jgi:hypothetical protein